VTLRGPDGDQPNPQWTPSILHERLKGYLCQRHLLVLHKIELHSTQIGRGKISANCGLHWDDWRPWAWIPEAIVEIPHPSRCLYLMEEWIGVLGDWKPALLVRRLFARQKPLGRGHVQD
jgi:hypothetical protein